MSFAFQAGTQISALFLLNLICWKTLNSVHHLGPKLKENLQIKIKKYKHLHADSSVNSQYETYSPLEHLQQKAEDECWIFYCNNIAEQDYLSKQISLLKRSSVQYDDNKYT